MMMPPCSQPLGEREDLTETMPPVALRSLVDSGSRQDDQFGRMVRTTARRPARCGKPDPFAPKENPATGRELWRGSRPPAFFCGGEGGGAGKPPPRPRVAARLYVP